MNAFLTALGLFTVLPAPVRESIDRRAARGAMLAFGWLGLALGAVAAAAAAGVWLLGGGALLAAAVGLGLLALITGAMHLDGLADTADGLGSRRSRDEALAIMKRSDIGPMGVAALVLVLFVDVAALASPRLGPAGLVVALLGAPAFGRLAGATATGRWVPCARPGGFGSLFAGVLGAGELVADGVLLGFVAAAAGYAAGGVRGLVVSVVAGALATVAGALWRRRLVRRFGGITGDIIGSAIEVAQLAFLLVCALAW